MSPPSLTSGWSRDAAGIDLDRVDLDRVTIKRPFDLDLVPGMFDHLRLVVELVNFGIRTQENGGGASLDALSRTGFVALHRGL